jgi:hypothetical protein
VPDQFPGLPSHTLPWPVSPEHPHDRLKESVLLPLCGWAAVPVTGILLDDYWRGPVHVAAESGNLFAPRRLINGRDFSLALQEAHAITPLMLVIEL